MAVKISARQALTPAGWRENVTVHIADDGRIGRIGSQESGADAHVGVLLQALSNVHSHSFQRAMAGMTEHRAGDRDDFWSWRTLMYRFLDILTPEDIEAIAALVSAQAVDRDRVKRLQDDVKEANATASSNEKLLIRIAAKLEVENEEED